MKTPRTLQTKRTRPKSGFRMLHAATRMTKKRKQRASTAAAPADLGEVPGVGVARALVVILLLHVAAIAGIYLHNSWSEGADIEANVPALQKNVGPARIAGLQTYTVNVGDNYEKIARKKGVDREALVRVNEDKVLQAGWIINIPNRRSEEISPSDAMGDRDHSSTVERGYPPIERPVIQTSADQSYLGSLPGEMGEVEGVGPEPTNVPIFVKPRHLVVQDPPVREPAIHQPEPTSRSVATGRRHLVRDGETFWRIATNNGVSVDALKRANPKVNVTAMKIGTSLVIPAKR